MKTIFKYQMTGPLCSFKMDPLGKPLHFDMQDSKPTFWALVDNEGNGIVTRNFRIFGTGHPISPDDKLEYIGTCIDCHYVWHLFEELQ